MNNPATDNPPRHWIRHEEACSIYVNGYQAEVEAKARLIAHAPALLEHAQKSLQWMLGERECYLEGCSHADGEIPEAHDRDTLASLDRDIDELTALITAATTGSTI